MKKLPLIILAIALVACATDIEQDDIGTVRQATGTTTCPGDPYTLTPGTSLTLSGTVSGTDNFDDPFCDAGTDTSGGEKVYAFTIPQEGTLKISVTGSGFKPVLYARNDCNNGAAAASAGCYDYDTANTASFVADYDLPFLPNVLYVFVDGDGPGSYTMNVTFETQTCGDSVWNLFTTSEECDDGNASNGDGCSSTCMLEAPGPNNTCNGENVFIGGGGQVVRSGRTTGYTNAYDPDPAGPGTCQTVFTGASGGSEKVYRVRPFASGTLTATVGLGPNCALPTSCELGGLFGESPNCWDYVIWATGSDGFFGSATCGINVNQIACADDFLNREVISFPVQGFRSYYVYVDGFSNWSFGNFNVCFEMN